MTDASYRWRFPTSGHVVLPQTIRLHRLTQFNKQFQRLMAMLSVTKFHPTEYLSNVQA